MKAALLYFLPALIASTAAARQATDPGKQDMQRSCSPCHSLRLVESQRLSRAAWGKEIDKMVAWGAVVHDRDALLNYLAEQYSDAKPVPRPPLSGDGSGKH